MITKTTTKHQNLFFSFFVLFSLFIALLPSPSFAQPTNTDSSAQAWGIDCSDPYVECLSAITVTKNVYRGTLYKCPVFPSPVGPACSTSGDKTVYGDDPIAITNYTLSHLISITAINDGKYVPMYLGYNNCVVKPDTSYECDVQRKIRISTTGLDSYDTVKMGAYLYRYALTTCPNGQQYLDAFDACLKNESRTPVAVSESTGQSCKESMAVAPNAAETKEQSSKAVGNPVDVSTGAKVLSQTDISFPIDFTRTYSSLSTSVGDFSTGWRHPYQKSLAVYYSALPATTVNAKSLTFKAENNAEMYFTRPNSTSAFSSQINLDKDNSVAVEVVSANLTRYTLTTANNQKETYEVNTSLGANSLVGKLTKMESPNGFSYTFTYNALGQMSTITDSYGHWLQLTYSDYANVITQVSASNGDYVSYTYLNGYLSQAKFNNTETIGYTYNAAGDMLSRIDENGNTFALYTYDNQHRVTEGKLVSAPGVYVNRYQYAYTSSATTVTLPDNAISVYNLTGTNYRSKIVSSNIAANKQSTSLSYDANGNVSSLNDGINFTNHTYNTTTNLLSSSSYQSINRNYTWNATTRLLSSYTENAGSIFRTYNFTYDSNSNITQKQITANSVIRTWNYTYGTFGKMLTATDPTGSTTTIAYYSDTHADLNLRGLPNTITNGAGHITTINSYDNRGNPTSITYPNSITKTMTYDLRGRMLTETMLGATNTYVYDAIGQMTSATLGNGYSLTISYDMAHRLIGMSDNKGNSLVYTLDVNGNATNESEYTNSVLVSVKNKVFDSISRPTQESGVSGSYPYNYTYDKLDRVAEVKDPDNATQTIAYNAKDDPTTITGLARNQTMTRDYESNITSHNQSGNTTSYTYNGYNEVLTMTSPDTGYHTYTYSPAGKTETHTDAGSTLHTLNYDNLGRPTTISHGTLTETYTWDTLKQGELTSIADISGSTNYTYDTNSRLASKNQTTGSSSKTVAYAYDAVGQLNKMTYPSGMEINYSYDKGQIADIKMGSTTVLNSINYRGFDFDVVGWSWGNTTTRSMGIDANDRLTSLTDGSVMNKTITLDNVGNITGTTDTANSNNSFTATYSNSRQLLTFGHTLGSQTLTQDAKFNLTSLTPLSSTVASLGITHYSNNNKIQTASYAGVNKTPTYNTKGMLTADGKGGVFTYDLANNLATANTGKPATYTYNALHQRVSKTVVDAGVSTTTYFTYNEAGLLIGEYNSSGTAIAEHIYFGALPVGVVKSGVLYYVHTDHLGTPRAITNYSGVVVWKWENTNAFGNNLANETVSGPVFEYNLRFPGQYFDKETNLHYNYHRHYNPETGRYMQPDPIGTAGGMNLYSYVENSPLGLSDPYGLIMIPFTDFDLGKDSFNQSFVDFMAGYGDSASIGITRAIRKVGNFDEVDHCSRSYKNGESTEMAMSIASYGLSKQLMRASSLMTKAEHKASRALGEAREAYQSRKATGKQVHHIQPLKGHPGMPGYKGGEPTLFPTASLPAWIHSSFLNLKAVPTKSHGNIHLSLKNQEIFWGKYHSPLTTGLKATGNFIDGCGC